MRIIHVITSFGIGGAEKLLVNVMNKQIENNEVFLIYLKNNTDLVLQLNSGIKTEHIPLSIFSFFELKKKFRQIQPDIIHTHLSHADILGIISSIGNKAKIFCTMHNIYFKKNFIDKVLFSIYKFLFKIFSVNVISISKSVEKHVLNTLKLPKERSFLLYNAIPPNPNIKIDKKSKKTNLNLLFVGRLVKQKSIDTLLKAIKHLKKEKIFLTIVGDGELRPYLENLATELNILNKVAFVGKSKNVYQYFYESDIFILPSIWEGFGIVILEAFSSKNTVIATNIEGPSELIKDGENGLLFEPKNHLQLANHIKNLIENQKKRNSLAEEGYKTYNEKFHIKTYVKKLQMIYETANN